MPVKIPKSVLRARRKRPKFVRQESWRYVRLETTYRRPRGKDSRMRLQKSGSPPLVKVGYGSDRRYKGLHPSGYVEALVCSLKDLEKLSPEKHAVRLSGRLGVKKLAIFEEARSKGFRVLNPPVKVEVKKG
jgi:large subunit ribosomal protein L32e